MQKDPDNTRPRDINTSLIWLQNIRQKSILDLSLEQSKHESTNGRQGGLYTSCALLTRKNNRKQIVQFVLLIARAVLIHHLYAGHLLPHILADWTTQCKSHYLFTHGAPCLRTRQLKTTGRRRQETDNKYVDLCGSYGITIEGMRRQQTEKTTCGSDEQSKVMTSFFFFFWFSCEHQASQFLMNRDTRLPNCALTGGD